MPWRPSYQSRISSELPNEPGNLAQRSITESLRPRRRIQMAQPKLQAPTQFSDTAGFPIYPTSETCSILRRRHSSAGSQPGQISLKNVLLCTIKDNLAAALQTPSLRQSNSLRRRNSYLPGCSFTLTSALWRVRLTAILARRSAMASRVWLRWEPRRSDCGLTKSINFATLLPLPRRLPPKLTW